MNTLRNKVSLIGRLGREPELTQFASGNQVARMSLATNERYKDKSGEWVDNTQWHNIVMWGKQAERAVKALSKGTEVVIEGRLVNKSFEGKSGEKRYNTEVEVMDFLVITHVAK